MELNIEIIIRRIGKDLGIPSNLVVKKITNIIEKVLIKTLLNIEFIS